jgi:hypothetical protein
MARLFVCCGRGGPRAEKDGDLEVCARAWHWQQRRWGRVRCGAGEGCPGERTLKAVAGGRDGGDA